MENSMETIFRESAKAIGQIACQKLMNEIFKEEESVKIKKVTTKVETDEGRWSRWTKTYTDTFKKCLTDANVKCEEKDFDKLKKEFVKYLNDLTEEDYKKDTKTHPERMKDFADLKSPEKKTEPVVVKETKKKTMWEEMTTHEAPKNPPSNAVEITEVDDLDELRNNELLVTVDGCPKGVFWNGRDGGWVKGPDPVKDSDMVEDVLFEKKLYDVAKDGCVYYYDEKREGHIWAGYLGVGKFHNMKLPTK
jgi:hypothetical protein